MHMYIGAALEPAIKTELAPGGDSKQVASSTGRGGAELNVPQPQPLQPPQPPQQQEEEEEGDVGEAEAEEVEDDVALWQRAPTWPFEPLCAELRCSLFHARWQVCMRVHGHVHAQASVHA